MKYIHALLSEAKKLENSEIVLGRSLKGILDKASAELFQIFEFFVIEVFQYLIV